MVNVTSTENNQSLVTASIKIGGSTYVTVIAVYGPQENENEDVRSAFYEEISIEITSSINRGDENFVVVGDFNAKIESENSAISAISPNGTLLHELIKDFSLDVLNFDSKCTGKWTRVQEKNGKTERSVIDYAITNNNLCQHFSKMFIDEEKLTAPFWLRPSKSGKTRQHSDHNVLLTTFTIPTTKMDRKQQTVDAGWKITPEGLIKFKEITEDVEFNPEDDDIISSLDMTLNTKINQCFQKRKPPRKHPNLNKENIVYLQPLMKVLNVVIPFTKMGKAERAAARKYICYIQELQNQSLQEHRAAKVTNIISQIQLDDGSMSVDKFLKLKKTVSPRDNTKSSVLVGTTEVCNPAGIIKEYQKEFVNRLSHRKIDDEFKEYETTTMRMFNMCLKVASENKSEPDFTANEVDKAVHSLSRGTSSGPDNRPPDIYSNSGHGLITMITAALNYMKNNLTIPADLLRTIIVTIYKNKGSRKILEYYRGIFLGNTLIKILEKVIKMRITPYLRRVNPLQAGSRSNSSPCDCTFILNAIIDHAKYLKKKLYITFYDYSQCFDSLWFEDSMISLWNIGIRNELFSLIFKLNEATQISVRTPFGMSEQFLCSRIVKQGSVLSSNICSTSTGEICDSNLKGFAVVGDTQTGSAFP